MFPIVLSLPSLGWTRTKGRGIDPASDQACRRSYREPAGDARGSDASAPQSQPVAPVPTSRRRRTIGGCRAWARGCWPQGQLKFDSTPFQAVLVTVALFVGSKTSIPGRLAGRRQAKAPACFASRLLRSPMGDLLREGGALADLHRPSRDAARPAPAARRSPLGAENSIIGA